MIYRYKTSRLTAVSAIVWLCVAAVSGPAASGPAISDPAVSGPAISDPAASGPAAATAAEGMPQDIEPSTDTVTDTDFDERELDIEPSTDTVTDTDFDERELAIVRRQIPSVMIRNITESAAQIGSSLFDGDTLRTDADGYAMVLFMDQSVTRIRPESQLIIRGRVNQDRSSTTRIDVNSGEIFMNVNRQSNSDVEVGTSTTVVSVKGTEFGARSSGYIWVEEGEVEVRSVESGRSVTISGRMYARISDDGMDVETGELTAEEVQSLSQDYRVLDSELQDRTIKFRFMDENGQIREVEIDYFENSDQ